jgi:alpha/beta superfamily hydrolase
MSSSDFTVESFTVESTNNDGVKLHTRLFKPGSTTDIKDKNFAIILIHPYSILGGSQGLLKGIASGLACNGYTAITFDMRGVGKSTGKPSLTGFAEVKDIVSVSNWVSNSLSIHRILLIGSSAGNIFISVA